MLAAQWHPSLNRSLTPYDVSSGSVRDIWWMRGAKASQAESAIAVPNARQMSGRGVVKSNISMSAIAPIRRGWGAGGSKPGLGALTSRSEVVM